VEANAVGLSLVLHGRHGSVSGLVATTGSCGGELSLEVTSTCMHLVPLDVAVLQLAHRAAARVERPPTVQHAPVVETHHLT